MSHSLTPESKPKSNARYKLHITPDIILGKLIDNSEYQSKDQLYIDHNEQYNK